VLFLSSCFRRLTFSISPLCFARFFQPLLRGLDFSSPSPQLLSASQQPNDSTSHYPRLSDVAPLPPLDINTATPHSPSAVQYPLLSLPSFFVGFSPFFALPPTLLFGTPKRRRHKKFGSVLGHPFSVSLSPSLYHPLLSVLAWSFPPFVFVCVFCCSSVALPECSEMESVVYISYAAHSPSTLFPSPTPLPGFDSPPSSSFS